MEQLCEQLTGICMLTWSGATHSCGDSLPNALLLPRATPHRAVAIIRMALFGPGLDLEAGEAVAAPWTGRLQPINLRHNYRAQASQRFIVGTSCNTKRYHVEIVVAPGLFGSRTRRACSLSSVTSAALAL